MKVTLAEAYDLLKVIIEKSGFNMSDEIEINYDYYWNLDVSEMFDFEKKPEVMVGSLYDDHDWLKRIATDDFATILDFERFAHLLLGMTHSIREPGGSNPPQKEEA